MPTVETVLDVRSVEEFVQDRFDLHYLAQLPEDISVSVSDRLRDAYYDFVGLALQLSEYGLDPVGSTFPRFVDSYVRDADFVFENRFGDDDTKRVYLQRGVRNGEPFFNIGIRNYEWEDGFHVITTPKDMTRYVRSISYGPSTISDILTGLDFNK